MEHLVVPFNVFSEHLPVCTGSGRGDSEHAALCQHGPEGEVQPPVHPGPPGQAGAQPEGHHQQAEEPEPAALHCLAAQQEPQR